VAAPTAWTPDPFNTSFEQRDDGVMLMRPLGEIRPYPPRLLDWLEHWAGQDPQRVVVARRDASGAWRSITYGQMLVQVRRLAAGLVVRGLSADRPLLILSGNSLEHLTLSFAAMWAGIPYCSVSPAYSQVAGDLAKLQYVLKLLTPGLVAAFDTRHYERALAVVDPAIEVVGDSPIERRSITSFESLEAEPSALLDEHHAATGADTIVKFLLTSGSTGQPKAVITTNRMLCSNAAMLQQAMPFVIEEPPILVDWLPWNHTFGGSHNIGLVLSNGGTLYIDDGKPTPSGIAATIANLREISPTVYFNVPKGFEMIALRLQSDDLLRGTFYRRLRACFFAGASLAQHTWEVVDAASIAERGLRTPILSGLGATETGPSVTFTTPAMGRSGVIGLPASGTLVKLAPVQEKVEIRAKSPSVTPGYWRQPELTAQAFDEEGFYRLGDAVRLIDPADPTRGLKFDGRIGEDFKLANGTWVSVGPLRADLISALAPIAQDVVFAGLDEDFVAAIVIPDVAACANLLGLTEPTYGYLSRSTELMEKLRERLDEHARRNPSSTRCVRRAIVLPSPPSLDHGEITDKGSINQRAVLHHRHECVAALYAATPPVHVVDIEGTTCT
jgi:feruloyl-CoA synthase